VDDMLYSIAQVSAITGIAKPTIRFWGKEFAEFLHPQRTEGNQRRFTRADVEIVERINRLIRQEGFTLEGARRKMQSDTIGETIATDPKLEELADAMSDYLLKRLLAKTDP